MSKLDSDERLVCPNSSADAIADAPILPIILEETYPARCAARSPNVDRDAISLVVGKRETAKGNTSTAAIVIGIACYLKRVPAAIR
jgi:hypothetical protein